VDAQRIGDVVGDRNDQEPGPLTMVAGLVVAVPKPTMRPMLVTTADVPPKLNVRRLNIVRPNYR
jgi:hypothetical protein